MHRIKVVWICHFSNEQIRRKLPLSNKKKYTDFAPWITNLSEQFRSCENIELHIIAPHRGLKKIVHGYVQENITYHFFKPDLPIVQRNWPSFFAVDKWTGYLRNRLIVHHLVNKIKPDLINLHGAENPYYSSTIKGLEKYPIYLCVQGIYSNPERFYHLNKNEQRCKSERRLHKTINYFGIRAPFMKELIQRDNPAGIFLMQNYPLGNISSINYESDKSFDFVYFARITPTKGIEDLLDAMVIVKKAKPNAKLNIIGPSSHKYTEKLKQKVRDLLLEENVTFAGAFGTTEELHKEVVKAKISVLPTKIDTIPGTIIESIQLGLPVISYKTGGIPFLNSEGQAVLLSKNNDINKLAENMIKVLNNKILSSEMQKNAIQFVKKHFNAKNITLDFLRHYNAIINNYHSNEPLPNDLIFNSELF